MSAVVGRINSIPRLSLILARSSRLATPIPHMIEGVGLRCQNCNNGGGSYRLHGIDFEKDLPKKKAPETDLLR